MAARGYYREADCSSNCGDEQPEKITSSMKMVSQAKMKGDGMRLDQAKPFAKWVDALGPRQEIEFIDLTISVDEPFRCLQRGQGIVRRR